MEPNNIAKLLPPLLSGEDLINTLSYFPAYDDSIREQDSATRLIGLTDLYKIYSPSVMSVEIYNKLYL